MLVGASLKYKELSDTEKELIRLYRELEAKKKEIVALMKSIGAPKIFVPQTDKTKQRNKEQTKQGPSS